MSDALGKAVFHAVRRAIGQQLVWDWVPERARRDWIVLAVAGLTAARAAWSSGDRALVAMRCAEALQARFWAFPACSAEARPPAAEEFARVWQPVALALLAAAEQLRNEQREAA